ncbi:MAG TPA: DHA2 family efflux MFS transporter permease subunit [Candidatus Sulfotelmatobacter sp.]|nr:DHA2 family efflux MFS transporter permease subunit [Candidatus Sulfotelmatobacter sp.]
MDVSTQIRVNPWVVTFSVMLATFMEVLDTTVVNVSIPHIAGNLASTNEEGTWVVTSYLVSNAIVLPISGWLANHFGRKRLLLACVGGFTVTSLCCGLATSLPQLIIFRVLQGLSGGGLQPLAQAILLETFPKERHGHAMAAFGIGILLAPILGPTLGGWITDNYSWRWIFYLNLPVGILSWFLMTRFVFDPHYVKRSGDKVDLWGIGFLALGIGSLQIFLDTGERKDWFSSSYIRTFVILCIVGLVALVIRELMTDHPVVDLRALKNRSFAAGVFLISMLGFILYASLVLLPLYLQTLMGYPAYNSGLALSPRGIGALVFTPLAGHLTTKTDPRRLLVVGLVLGSITMFDLSGLNLYAGFWDIFWAQMLQGVALAFLFIPLMSLAMSRIAPERMGNATSIFNLMRNIGGSVGIAVMTTFLARRTQRHQEHLIAKITPGDPATLRLLQGLRTNFYLHGSDSVTAARKALGALYGMVERHASMLAFVEAFWVMGVVFLLMLPFLPLMQYRRARKSNAEVGAREARDQLIPAVIAEHQPADLEPEACEEENHLVLH